VAAMIKQARLRESVGESASGWSADLPTGRLRLGAREFAVEPIGTEAMANDSFVWAWGNPSMQDYDMPATRAVRALGEERGIPDLVDDFEIPVDRLDAFVASVLTVGIAGLDAYYLAPMDEEGAGYLALGIRDRGLRVGSATAGSLVSTFMHLLQGAPPFSYRRAFAHYLARPLPAVPAEIVGGKVVLSTGSGTVTVSFDREGRIGEIKAEEPGDSG
jgi:hypothetical protein